MHTRSYFHSAAEAREEGTDYLRGAVVRFLEKARGLKFRGHLLAEGGNLLNLEIRGNRHEEVPLKVPDPDAAYVDLVGYDGRGGQAEKDGVRGSVPNRRNRGNIGDARLDGPGKAYQGGTRAPDEELPVEFHHVGVAVLEHGELRDAFYDVGGEVFEGREPTPFLGSPLERSRAEPGRPQGSEGEGRTYGEPEG